MRRATPLHEAWPGVDERHAPLRRAWRGDRHQDLVDLGSPNSKEPGRLRIASFALCITQHANGGGRRGDVGQVDGEGGHRTGDSLSFEGRAVLQGA